jgi:hypothetical protein
MVNLGPARRQLLADQAMRPGQAVRLVLVIDAITLIYFLLLGKSFMVDTALLWFVAGYVSGKRIAAKQVG